MRSPYASMISPRQREIMATVRFGLITMKCKGRGICSVTADGPDLKLQECNYAKARICIEPNNGLAFFFEKSSMRPCSVEQYFGSGFFEIEEAFEMPEAIIRLLEIGPYVIYPGTYKVTESKSFMKVIF